MKCMTSVFTRAVAPVALAGVALGLGSCASMDSGQEATTAPSSSAPDPSVTTSAPATAPVAPITSATPTTPSASPTTSAPVTIDSPPGATTDPASVSPTVAPSTSTTSDVASADTGSAEVTSEEISSAPAAEEDLDMTADDFECISNWDKVLGFRINNLLGHLDEAKAVANSTTGGKYPVGTILQHLPTEAMVKRRTGFSPETKDWEFFLLTLGQDGTTTIAQRGTTDIKTSMGQACVECHTNVADEWDFVCNTWAAHGGGNCGFDFMDSFLDGQLATDTRCK
jgi:hypothetical protein